MRRTWVVVGATITSVGVLIALFPVFSVWRLSDQVLDQLPPIAAESADEEFRFSLRDPDFVLATRTYEAMTEADIEAELRAGGFDTTRIGGEQVFSKECCGEYDAVWVRIAATEPNSTTATLTVADSDVQAVWQIFLFLGIPIGLLGLFTMLSALKGPTDDG